MGARQLGRGRPAPACPALRLFLALYLLAETGETRAFRPLCRLLEDAETADLVLGDTITEGLSGILISLFDGDGTALQRLVETEAADPFVRDAAMIALSYLTRVGRVSDADMQSFRVSDADMESFRVSDTDMQSFPQRSLTGMMPQEPHIVWMSWVVAAAHPGYSDLAGGAEAMIRDGRVPSDIMEVSHFHEDLQRTLDDPAGVAGIVHDRIGPLTDTIAEIAGWVAYGKADIAPDAPEFDLQMPIINPLRGIGRDNLCPCGSSRKFKKCCLA